MDAPQQIMKVLYEADGWLIPEEIASATGLAVSTVAGAMPELTRLDQVERRKRFVDDGGFTSRGTRRARATYVYEYRPL